MRFIFNMAWRDSRHNRARLFLFVSAVVAGVAALTAVRSFSVNLRGDIDREAKTLLGADLLVDANTPAPDSLLELVRKPATASSEVVNFLSMVRFPSGGGTRLSQIRALEGGYPYYGKWATAPENAGLAFRAGKSALIEHALALQFGVKPGDSIQVGQVVFTVAGELLSSPGRSGIASSVAPVVFIPMRWLDSTGLVQRGSRVTYQYYFQYPDDTDVEALLEPHEKRFEKANLDTDTVEERQRGIGTAFANFSTFLNLVGFVALLLGCVGVAGAVHLYIRDKLPTVAILRCLGASGRKAFLVYLVQVAGIGFLGALAGALLGSVVQQVLPWLMKDLLPIADVSTHFSWLSVGQGILLGLSVSVLFALLPLAGILRTAPLRTLRASVGEAQEGQPLLRGAIIGLLVLALGGLTYWLVGTWWETLAFLGGMAVAFAVLLGVARLLTFFLRRFFPKSWPYVWRQGIANLFRPENQTLLLVVTIGLGTMLLATLFLSQSMLLRQIEFAGSGRQPNMVLFDIQAGDADSVIALTRRFDMPLFQRLAVVTTRIDEVNGRNKQEDLADSINGLPRWVWNREFRVTFRDTLVSTETLQSGDWQGTYSGSGPVPISISDGMESAIHAGVGTRLTFNVQGTRVETVVASVRKVSFNQVQPSFMVVFPTGVLEKAPQFQVLVSRVNSTEQSAAFQSELVRRYPGISAIDLTQILRSVDEVLTKVSFVIRFMALFCILTGLLVLVSSIYQSKFARIRESVLLRTLGASRRQILWINALEYAFLGALSCVAGLGLAVAGAWALAHFSFHIPFHADGWPLVYTFLAITALTVVIGLFNSRGVVTKPPLEVLRAEVG